MVFVCDICGYEYNPDAGDPDNGVEPGTAFPLCGAEKGDFVEE